MQDETQHYEQTAPYSEPYPSHRGSDILIALCLLAFLGLAGYGFIASFPQFKAAAIILAWIFLGLVLLVIGYLLWHKWRVDSINIQAQRDEIRRKNELHRISIEEAFLSPDLAGNYQAIWNRAQGQLIQPAAGQFIANVPNHQHIEYNYSDTSTRAIEAGKDQDALAALHIPTFAESLASGDIGPSQRDMLFCYEILQDEVTRKITGISPIRGDIGEQHTQLVIAGSQSGKTTYMAGDMAQAAILGTLFYIIDPHKNHPEKSIAAKMAAYAPWFILPPAASHEEIRQLLKHATKVRDARIAGKPTMYDGYHIMVVVDEVPALMANQKSSDKNIKQLYLDLALFMQSLGIQTAKFGITGLYASQFATKEALGEIDFRDACMSTLIMRLHPTQAQAMRTLGKEAVRDIPKFPKGHGYLLLADSTETRHVASGNVTQQDLNQLAALLPPSPLVKVDVKEDRNVGERRSIIPFPEGISGPDFTGESGWKEDGKRVGNRIDSALQAKLDEMGISEAYITLKVQRVTDMLGQDKTEIIKTVWGVSPGRGKAYEDAKVEYGLVMEIIRSQAQHTYTESEA